MNQILSEYGQNFLFSFSDGEFVKPFLIIDKLCDNIKTPIIENYFDTDFLKVIDFTLYSKQLTKKTVWVKRQKMSIHILPSESPVPPGYRKLKTLPPNHYIERDVANHRVRLIGIFTNPSGYGLWTSY